MTLQESVAEAEAIRENHFDTFVQTARRAALGEQIDAAEIERITSRIGKSPADFSSMVGQFENRARLRKQLATARAAESLHIGIQAQISDANEQLEAAAMEHQRVTAPLQAELVRLRDAMAQAIVLPGELCRSCPSRELRDRSALLQSERDRVERRLTAARDEIEKLRAFPGEQDAEKAQRAAKRGRVEADAALLLARRDELAEQAEGVVAAMIEY
ncbi:MAG: hypothetical protein HYX69_06930 [Planctomycetia bacterium]|nr:hypothetical protein [Planctomycetia bacterium]